MSSIIDASLFSKGSTLIILFVNTDADIFFTRKFDNTPKDFNGSAKAWVKDTSSPFSEFSSSSQSSLLYSDWVYD